MASSKLSKAERAEFKKMLAEEKGKGKKPKGKKPSKAEVAKAARILGANKKNKKAKSAAKRAASKRPKRGFKLSATTKAKIAKKSKAHWKSITGNGTPKSHIPLAQLKKNQKRLAATIAEREKSPAKWA